ncbi:hypothetical protein ES288_D02G016600v1 [Gossypium darwinii]|uniref:Zinc finger PHD-type domain-containing protein n=1 Tax=Gossypium darwinii TaxID=34276 RepID=A0A5D2DBS3_GOSDA|nr:hypothetical protein ES288_D02G016600v1 [Gossypium darwinii]
MEESNNYGHQHPLLLILNQDQLIHNQSGVTHCSRCGEEVSVPCFCCVEHCGFYLHKACADAPLELNHPFHPHHPLVLLQEPPSSYTGCVCDFCDKTCQKFIYHCSCELDFHIKCALFTFNVAENNLKELDHVSLQHPFISTGNGDEELEDVSKCFGCREPLAKYTQFSLDCRFNLHEKCAKLPFKLNHNCHHKHPLTLQFNSERLSCKICQVTRRRGFVYGCSPCKFVVHIECVSESLDLVVEDKRHRHPFTLLLRGSSFICDACGTEGSYASYICCTCNIMVHKKCTSLPRIIKSKWHDHRLFHKYFLRIEDFRVLDCIICHDEVNTEHGSYYCSKCTVIFHVKCVMKDKDSYEIVENEDKESPDESVSSITKVLERNDAGEATVIEHFKHNHYLILSDRVGEYDDKCCGGCLLPIVASFYYCTLCDFFLHKVCVELPKVKHVWHHRCRPPLVLISNEVFECVQCLWLSNAFAYKCEECKTRTCFRCIIALTPGACTCLGHKHPLLFYPKYIGRCVACGKDGIKGLFRCKDCDFSLDYKCFSLPITSQYKNDQHLLSLAYGDDNSYSESHFCDVCEESRDPNLWFYNCATCDTSAHINCVLSEYPFLKLGSIFKLREEVHEHPLTNVKKIYYYPNCGKCGKPCFDLAFECTACNFIIHKKCASATHHQKLVA